MPRKLQHASSFIVDRSDTVIFDIKLYALVDEVRFRASVNDWLGKLSLVLILVSVGILIAGVIVACPVVLSLLEEQTQLPITLSA